MRLIRRGPAWSRTEGTALSRHRTATLEATRPVSVGATNGSRSSASTVTTGPAARPRGAAPATVTAGPAARSRGSAPAASKRSAGRSRRRKRGLFRRRGIVLPAFGLAVLLVAGVTAAAYVMSPKGAGANSLAEAIDSLPHSGSVALLEQERQNLIVMNAAAKTLSSASKPVTVNPSQVVAQQQAAQQAAQQQAAQQQAAQQQAASAPVPDP